MLTQRSTSSLLLPSSFISLDMARMKLSQDKTYWKVLENNSVKGPKTKSHKDLMKSMPRK